MPAPSTPAAPIAADGAIATRPLSAPAIAAALEHAAGWTIDVVAETGSTNADLVAAVRAAAALPRPAIRAAERQTAGRGRLGRPWDAPPGRSLAVSFAFPIARPLGALDGITLVCGLAVRDAVSTVGVDATLKWPNDVLWGGRKLAGILVEALAIGGEAAVVVGVGLNVLGDAGVGADGALSRASLADAGARTVNRDALVAAIGDALAARLARFAASGFAPFRAEWEAADAFAGRAVTLSGAGTPPEHGIARGVDDDGALRLDIGDAIVRVVGGDVSLRPDPR